MINLLIKLVIYIIFVIILPQYCTGTLQLLFKSIGFIALCGVLCDIINAYGIEFYLLTLGIIIIVGINYLIEVILDKR